MESLTFRSVNNVHIVQCSGLLAEPHMVILKPQLRQLIQQHQGQIVFDLSRTIDIDAHSLGALVCLQILAKQYGGELRLLKPSPKVINRLEFIRLQHTFTLYQDEIAATTYYSFA